MKIYYVWFILSVFMLFVGHYFRMLRWRQSIMVYENVGRKLLLYSLILGYVFNFLFPVRVLGDIIRGIYSGRRLKNGCSLSFASILIERGLDVFIVSILFGIIVLFYPKNNMFLKTFIYYIILVVVLLIFLGVCIKYSVLPKKIIKAISSIFNSSIKLWLMTFSYSFILAIKDLFYRWNKKQLFFYTSVMWGAYLLSYYLLSQFLYQISRNKLNFSDIFYLLFSQNNMELSMLFYKDRLQSICGVSQILLIIYILAPLVIILLLSLLQKFQIIKIKLEYPVETLYLLSQIKEKDRLKFLEQYFSDENKEFMNLYINLNNHIQILEDFSAGSNATTMLCMNHTQTFYRKYAFGSDGKKLLQQLNWIVEQRSCLPLCNIIHFEYSEQYCCYDMEYQSNAIGMFRFLHSNPIKKSEQILSDVLDTLNEKLYTQNQRVADKDSIEKYIRDKVYKNLEKIRNAKQFHEFIQSDVIIINGKKYKNLPQLNYLFSEKLLNEIFSKDKYSAIHGDLTIENIICYSGKEEIKSSYYIIDPNTGNIHDSCFLDYGKLLQSLHGGYEFLMLTDKVSVKKNQIYFSSTRSAAYDNIFEFLKNYLYEHFTKEEVKSIFFHEMIHWLRLLPYKIKKDGDRACLFYAGLIIVCNDIEQWFMKGNN